MSDLNVTLRINADGKVAVAAVRQVQQELEGIGGTAETAGARAEAGMGRARRGVESISQQLGRMRTEVLAAAASFVSFQGVRQLAAIADEMSRLRSQVGLVTTGQAELAATQNALFEISQRTSTGLAVTTQLYTRIARSTAELNLEQSRLLELTETINQTFVVSATPAAAAGNAITQLTQAFAGGVLRAEEFNSVIENSPRLAQALADGLGVGIGALREMVNEGQITSEAIIRALESQAETIRREFESMPLTIEQAWTQIANAVAKYIGDADQASGTSRNVAEAMAALARNLELVIDLAVTVGTILLAAYGARVIAAAVAYSVELARQAILARAAASAYAEMGIAAATASATGLRSLLTLQGALNGLLVFFAGWQIGSFLREQFVEVELAGIAMVRAVMEAWQWLKQSGLIVWEAIKAAAIGAVNIIRERIADMLSGVAGMVESVARLGDLEIMGQRLFSGTAEGAAAAASAIRAVEAAVRPTTSAYEGFLQAKERIETATGEEIARIRETTDLMADDAIARRAAASAAEEQAAAVAGATGELGGNAPAAKGAADAMNELARATDAAAEAYDRFWAASDDLQGMLDDIAAQMGGPSVRAAQELRDGLVRLAEIETALLAIGPMTLENQQRIQLAREGLARVYADTTDQIAADEQRMAAGSGRTVDDWSRTWMSGIDAVSFAFGDWLSGSLGSFRNFGRELLRIGQRIVADLIAQFARARILQFLGMGGAGIPGAAMAGTGGAAGGLGSLAGGITQGGGLLGGLLGSTFGAVGGLLSGLGGALGGFGAGLTVAGNAGLLAAGQFGVASLAAGNLAVGLGSLIPVVGTIAAVAAGINALTGGRLFGTSWKPTGTTGTSIAFGPSGATGEAFEEQSRRRSLFRGTARRTVSTPLDDRAMAQLDDAFRQIESTVTAAAQALRVEMPPLIAGAWREVRDQAGNVVSQTTTILGRQFSESFEDFQRRVTAENLVEVVQRALGAAARESAAGAAETIGGAIGDALAPIGIEIGGGLAKSIGAAAVDVSAIAERWRGNASELLDGAQFLLAAAVDIQRGVGLLGGAGSLPELADLIEDLAKPTETLVQTYGRVAAATQLLDQALLMSGVTVERARAEIVRFAVDIAEAAGGLDQAASLWQRYFEVAFTGEERLRAALTQAVQARDSILSGLGLDADTSLSEVRAAIEGLLAAGGDPERVVALLRAADAIATVNEILAQLDDLAGGAAEAVADLVDDLGRLAEIDRIMSEVFDALDGFEMSDFAREIQRIGRAEAQRIATLTALGASESQLAAVRRLATLETQAAIAGLRASIASLRDQLYGTPLSAIEAQIAAFQNGQLGAITAVGQAAQSMWQGQFEHVQRIDDYLRSLTTGPNSLLTPRQRVDAAMTDYRETLRLAQGGDAAALARITQVADIAFREMRSYYGSSGPTQDFFREMQFALSALRNVAGVGGGETGGGGFVGGGGGSAPVPPELAALLAERDRLIAEQQARERLTLATTLAQQLGELADALQRPFADLAAELGIDLEALARDLGIDPDGIADLIERLTTTRVAETQLAVLEGIGDVQLAALNETVTQTGILESIRDGIERLMPVDLPSYDVGSGGIPRTGPALVHRGEIVLPPAVSDFARRSGLVIGAGSGDSAAIERRLAELIQATREASERQERRLERVEAATIGSGDRIARTLESPRGRSM